MNPRAAENTDLDLSAETGPRVTNDSSFTWTNPPGAPGTHDRPAHSQSASTGADKIRILVLAAGPNGTPRLGADEQAREITEKLRLAQDRDAFELITYWAVRPADILQQLNQHRPHIVHFIGYGDPTGEIVLSSSSGEHRLNPGALGELFRTMKDDIRIVVLNAGYSNIQAHAIGQHIDYVIGMRAALDDEAAVIFAAAFYSALAFRRTVPEAFNQAKAAMTLHGFPDNTIPELTVRPNLGPPVGLDRASIRPLLEGDRYDNLSVRGFAWVAPPPGQRSNQYDDKLLLDGDEQRPVPPARAVPQTSDHAVASAPMPPADLDPVLVVPAARIDPTIPDRVDRLIDLPGAPWSRLSRPLLAAVHSTGHRVWLSGGAVRDTLSRVALNEVNDLDLGGTVPTGRFADITYHALRASGMAEYAVEVSPASLVCAVVASRPRGRLIEYRGLSRGGYRYPAVGSRLAEDALHRDFGFNTLFYDALDHEIYDPTGHGLSDLLGPARRFDPVNTTRDPAKVAETVLRAMKFALRWSGSATLDLEPLRIWLGGMRPDFWRDLAPHDWDRLRRERREDIPQPDSHQLAFAAGLPPAGRTLLDRLIEGAS